MRKFLCLLTAITVVTTTTAPLLTKILEANIANNNTIENKYYPPTSFKNFIYNINTSLGVDMDFVEKNSDISQKWHVAFIILKFLIDDDYKGYFNNKEGKLVSLKTISNEEVVETFNNIYSNNTSNKQTFKTQEYSKTITNTHSFSASITDSISDTVSISVSVKAPFISSEVKNELTIGFSNSQEWSKTISVSETLTNPSQSFIVNPYSIGRASYIIKQGTYYNEGVIRFPLDWSYKIASVNFMDEGSGSLQTPTLLEFITPTLKAGYADQMRMDSDKYSLISLENLENPESGAVYLNLPISWESQGAGLEVNFSETSL